jgi:hypothetical protein
MSWGGAAFGDSPLLPGAPTPLTRGGSSGQRRQLPHRRLLRACVRMQEARGALEVRVASRGGRPCLRAVAEWATEPTHSTGEMKAGAAQAAPASRDP